MKSSWRSIPAVKSGSRTNGLPLDLLGDLADPGCQDPVALFEKALKLLVDHLRVDRALLVRVLERGFETLWWATLDGSEPDPACCDPLRIFCPQILKAAPRPLVIGDVERDPLTRPPDAREVPPLRSLMGVPLRRGRQVIGILNIQNGLPRKFSRAEVILASMVANLMASAMEIELLKQDLHMTREALDLTLSVVEDSALEARDTRLPTRRYLDIWLKASLAMARRCGEPLALVLWRTPVNRESREALREVAGHARDEDLLVDLGRDTFLLILPRTSLEGAQVLAGRIHERFGAVPVGVAVLDPATCGDRDDLSLEEALQRARAAMAVSKA